MCTGDLHPPLKIVRTVLIQHTETVYTLRVIQAILCAQNLSCKRLHKRTMRLKISSAHTGQVTSPKTGFKLLKYKPKLIVKTPGIITLPWEVAPYFSDLYS